MTRIVLVDDQPLLRAGFRARDIACALDAALQLAADPRACQAIADGAELEALAA